MDSIIVHEIPDVNLIFHLTLIVIRSFMIVSFHDKETEGQYSIRINQWRINEIVLDKRSVTADTALRLARYFGTTPEFWLNLQSTFELENAKEKLGDALEKEISTWVA